MGLLDIWNDWRKESGYGRDDLTTAGGSNEQSLQELTNFYINAMHSDALSLGVEKPDFEVSSIPTLPFIVCPDELVFKY